MELDYILSHFGNIYTSQIVPKLAPFENERKKREKVYKLIKNLGHLVLVVSVISFLAYSSYFFKLPEHTKANINTYHFLIAVVIGLPSFIYSIAHGKNKDFVLLLKTDLLPIILSPFGKFEFLTESEYATSLVDLYEINSLGMYKNATRQHCDDEIKGSYKGTEISIVETKLEHTEGSGKSRHTVVDFRGLVIKTKLNKKYTGKTIILHKHNSHCSKPRKLETIKLEDVELDKLFDIYSNDQIEARYLLDMTFMERFKEAIKFFGANIDFVILNDMFYIFIGTRKDFFEIGKVNENVYNPENFRKVCRELVSIFKLIEHFDIVKEKQNAE